MRPFVLSAIIILCFSCSHSSSKPDVSDIKVNISVERFDQAFFALDTNRLHYSEITLKATFHHTPETVRKAFKLITDKKIKSADYITGEEPLSRLQHVLQRMVNRGRVIKTAIIPGH